MRYAITLFIVCTTMFLYSRYTFSQDDYIDRLELASLLIKNNNIAKAQSVLAEIKNPNDVQTDYYYILLGLIESKKGDYPQACLYFEAAQKSQVHDSKLLQFLEHFATALIKTQQNTKAKNLLDSHKEILQNRTKYYQLLAEYHFNMQEPQKGWDLLFLAKEKFPIDINIKKQIWYYLFENSLYNMSYKFINESIIPHHELTSRDYAIWTYHYRAKGELVYAAQMGEAALLKDPYNIEATKELARVYMQHNNYTAAAVLFEKLAQKENSYFFEASELWRKSKRYSHSEFLALKINNPEQQMKQKILLALEQKQYAAIKALAPFIIRSNLKENSDVIYTLAYSHFILGEYDNAQKYLNHISDDDLIDKTNSLKEAIFICQKSMGVCL